MEGNMLRRFLSDDELGLMSFFASVTGVVAKDCFVLFDCPVFIVENGNFAKALGKKERNLSTLAAKLNKKPLVVEYFPNPEDFLLSIGKDQIARICMNNNNGKKIARLSPIAGQGGRLVGKNGWKINIIRVLCKKYFDIDYVKVV
jgi:NusA-like KH domain protein